MTHHRPPCFRLFFLPVGMVHPGTLATGASSLTINNLFTLLPQLYTEYSVMIPGS